jgi:voltage-gated potassium channel
MMDLEQPEGRWFERFLAGRVRKRGLRPRLAAAVIASAWLVAIVGFGVLERVFDPDRFETVWDGMWWATQTVTTVGYGDIVPSSGAGRVIASILMIGGLSFFAVITGIITSGFVARAQARVATAAIDDPVLAKMTEVEAQLAELKAEMARLSSSGS